MDCSKEFFFLLTFEIIESYSECFILVKIIKYHTVGHTPLVALLNIHEIDLFIDLQLMVRELPKRKLFTEGLLNTYPYTVEPVLKDSLLAKGVIL